MEKTRLVNYVKPRIDLSIRLLILCCHNQKCKGRFVQHLPQPIRDDSAGSWYPIELINGLSTQFAGNSGEASGSTLRGNLTATIPAAIYQTPAKGGKATATGAYYVSYLGVSDANSVAASTTALRWNGVDFSELAVRQGQYTFWSYEHVLYRADSLGTTAETVALDLIAKLTDVATVLSPNVKLSDMQVSRGTDGGTITADFTF